VNSFNRVVSQLLSIDIKIYYEDKYIGLLCSLTRGIVWLWP
jgi:hypothetical protein